MNLIFVVTQGHDKIDWNKQKNPWKHQHCFAFVFWNQIILLCWWQYYFFHIKIRKLSIPIKSGIKIFRRMVWWVQFQGTFVNISRRISNNVHRCKMLVLPKEIFFDVHKHPNQCTVQISCAWIYSQRYCWGQTK